MDKVLPSTGRPNTTSSQHVVRNRSNIEERKYIPKPYQDVAKKMEGQFIQFMVEQMKKTAGQSEPDSAATNYYKGMLTEQQSRSIAGQDGGLGLQELILNQIYPKRLRNQTAYGAYKQQTASSIINRQRLQQRIAQESNDE
jgi:Rod binding domain-containing protein